MKFFATLAALSAFSMTVLAATYDCTSDLVKIGTSPAKCMCKSGYGFTSGTTCTTYENNGCGALGVDGTLPTPTANITNTIGDITLALNDAVTSDTKIKFTVKLPMANGRQFTALGLADATTVDNTVICEGAVAFDDITQAASTTSNGATTVCADSFTLVIKFSKLISCGFKQSDAKFGTPDAGKQRYGGIVRLAYTDSVSMGADDTSYAQTVTRTSTVDFPVVVDLQSQYTVQMSVNDVRVFAAQKVDFAVAAQTISKNTATAPRVDITYAIQYPYKIDAFGSCTPAVGNPLTCTPTLDTDECDDVAEFVTDGARLKTCTKTGSYLTFLNDRNSADTCQFVGDEYTLAFTVACGANVPAADCPLLAVDSTDNSVKFTITSENFCIPSTPTSTINNAIQINKFEAVKIDDFVTPKTAWRYGDVVFFRMQFNGLLMDSVKLTKLERYYSTDVPTNSLGDSDYTSVAGYTGTGITLSGFYDTATKLAAEYLNDAANNVQNPLPASLAGLDGKYFGLHQEGTNLYQVYRFALVANDALLGGSALRGQTKYMKLRATIDVTYNVQSELTSSRRRRRQATAGESETVGGQGAAESETQSIEPVEAAAVAPNSGVRAAPAVALVLAILSAVALL